MRNISPDILKQIQEAIRRTEGTVKFTYYSEELFDPKVPGGIIFEVVAGAQYYKVERDSNLQLFFYHSSPGTGTRVATIDLNKVKPSFKVYLAFSWTPKEINLYIGPYVDGGELIKATGVASPTQFRITKDGLVVQVGDVGVEIGHYSFFVGGKSMLQPTAIEVWINTVKAVEIIQGGSSEAGYIFENVISNLTLSTIVTGFEVYCKTRFIELEQEGIKPNIEAMVTRCFSKEERDTGQPEILKAQALGENRTFLEKIIEKRINFQSYEECKRAYNKAYGIKFGEIGFSASELQLLQRIIRYRHRIIHVSPLIGMLNQPEVPPDEPEFSNREFASKAIKCFDFFINKLHETTLSLKRND